MKLLRPTLRRLAWLPLLAAVTASAAPASDDPDGDGLRGALDPEPLVSNQAELFACRLESPTLTWELNMEQLSRTESGVEQAEQESGLLREAAQGVLDETARQESVRLTETDSDADPGRITLSVNPLRMFAGMAGGVGAIDAFASGIRLGGGLDARERREEKNDFLVLNRLTRERTGSKTEQVERRSRLLRLNRFTKILRNPRLQISLHVRNGGDTPLLIERPEVPVLDGDRALGVALPRDPRDAERIVIPPRRSQVILLQVPVADSDFWDALTRGGDSIRYAPELGAMRASFAGGPDLLAIRRDETAQCLPVRLLLPEGVAMERLVARADASGAPVTLRETLREWNNAWRRKNPEAGGDLFRIDDTGVLVAAAGRTGALAGASWRVEVDGKTLPLGASLDTPVRSGVRIRWSAGATATELADATLRNSASPWVRAGLTAHEEMRRLHAGGDAKAAVVALEKRLSADNALPPEALSQLLSALGEARRLAGDLGGARDTWRRAMGSGDAGAMLGLAQLALDAPDRGAEALTLMREAASAGSPEAMARLADLESRRPGAPADIAPRLLGQAAEAGYAPALTLLGQRYENGEGLPRDSRRAAALYRRAAERGDVSAMLRLGILHETGQGAPRDAVRAAAWYRAAATATPWRDPEAAERP